MKLNVDAIRRRKTEKGRIVMLTAYDAQMASLLESAGVDLLLVGDTLGMVFQGRDTTRVVTMEQMVYHVSVVCHGAPETFVVGDLPYGTFDTPKEAVASGKRLMEAGADAVKLEGDPPGVVKALVEAGIPVMGHLGLLPQTAESFHVHGKREEDAANIETSARSVAQAGAFSLVLEAVPEALAQRITAALPIPTIGIGAGKHCDGQVLVVNDMLGMTTTHLPKFVKRYADLAQVIRRAAEQYVEEVRTGEFPGYEQTYH